MKNKLRKIKEGDVVKVTREDRRMVGISQEHYDWLKRQCKTNLGTLSLAATLAIVIEEVRSTK